MSSINARTPELEVHDHHFVSGPRSPARFSHSHPDGGTPHTHPHTGPSFYGYRKPRVTTKPKGEQFELIALSEDEQSFELIITDSAKLGGETLIGDTPIKQIFMPAADRIMRGSRLRCIVRDERTRTEAGE